MAVQVSDGVSDRIRVPVIIDYRNFILSKYGINKAIAAYLGITKSGFDIDKALEKEKLYL